MKRHHARRTSGAVLVMTLWVIALLSLLAFAMVARVRMSVRGTGHAAVEVQYREALTTLAQMAVTRLARDEDGEVDTFREAWGHAYEGEGLDGLELAIVPVDEYAKINVNVAPRALLAHVLRELGASEEIAGAIVDWRDADALGAFEADAYTVWTPANTPLVYIDELLFVIGVTPELFFGEDANHNGALDPEEDDEALFLPADNGDGQLQPGLADLLTVQGEGAVNINTCGLPVLRTLLSYAAAPNADALARSILDRRRGPDARDGTDDDRAFQSAAEIEEMLGEELQQACQAAGIEFDVMSSAFRFHLCASTPSEHIVRGADMLVLREGNDLRVAEWHEGQ